MENPVRLLRKALELNQHQFADLVGLSYATIQNYEAGRAISTTALQRLIDLAHEHRLDDLARDIQEIMPGGPDPVPSGHIGSRHQRWHDMLETILESHNERAIHAVQSNLVVFFDYIQSKGPKVLQTKGKKVW